MIELRPNRVASLQSPQTLIAQALEKPVAAYPLKKTFRRSKNLVLVVSNRLWPGTTKLLLSQLLDGLNQVAVPDYEISVLVANGADVPLRKKALTALLGKDILRRVAVHQHDFRKIQEQEYLGETKQGTPVIVNKHLLDADEIILCDAVSHHIFAGYAGGPALIVPGCAGQETISRLCQFALTQNRQCVDPRCADGMMVQNPVYHEIRAACRNISPRFGLYAVTNSKGEPISAYAGNPYQAHAAACRAIDQLNILTVENRANLTIVSAGGAPKDNNFAHAYTALHRACRITRADGIVILVAACENGLGAPGFSDFFHDETAQHLPAAAEMTPACLTAMASRELTAERTVFVVSQLAPEVVKQMGFLPFASLQQALDAARHRQPRGYLTYVISDGTVVVPQCSSSGKGLASAQSS